LLRSQTGHDFSGYKLKTLIRRTKRRMAACQVEQMDAYVLHLQRDSSEIEALYRDLLIGVTSFFRDPDAFKALQEQVIPRLIDGRAANEEVRVWVPGCSTGEEAYSIAILIKERLVELKVYSQVKIFATDIDARAIVQARTGVYPASIAADVSPERLSHFFLQEAGSDTYRVHKFIRDMVIFSEQDVIAAPPFSRVDLISCRNLMIYMGADLQKKLIPLFHYALAPEGCLFLGTSETVGGSKDLFVPLDLKARLYQRVEPGFGRARVAAGGLSPMAAMRATTSPAPERPREVRGDPLRELTEQTLLLQHTTAAALVSERGDILYLHGRTGSYLEPAPGDAGMNILTMAREGLRRGLTSALRTAALSKESVRRPALRVRTNGDFKLVDLTVQPAVGGSGAAAEPPLFVVMLEETQTSGLRQADTSASVEVEGSSADASPAGEGTLATLRQELEAKEEYLQATLEEMETSNEELQSVNEELQSVNEELETSAEELQSLNEELGTVNAELQSRISDLTQSNNDMNNLLAGTGIGTIFVDLDLNIQRFTPTATRVINLIAADVGRPIGHIVSNLPGYDSLVSDIHAVLDTLKPREAEVQALDGAWYLLRILPYRTLENAIEGAAITSTEITELKRMQATLKETEGQRRLAIVVRDAHDAIAVQDLEGRILAWNPSAVRMYGWTESEALEMNIHELIPEGQGDSALEIVKRLSSAEVLEPYRAQRITKDGRIVGVWLTATALVNSAGDMYAVATTEREVVRDV
jgi:two-component system CheB/CheR fusion protein